LGIIFVEPGYNQKYNTMEQTTIAQEQKTENFNFSQHFVKALIGALYYLILYIPFILPYNIWGKAATRLSHVWESKTLAYNEDYGNYPLHSFYLKYVVNFIFDALIFLIWPIGLVLTIKARIDNESMDFVDILIMLFTYYVFVIGIRVVKEVVYFVLNTLVAWFLDVIKNIGQLIKNMWLLNIVIKRKDSSL
jgi:hypothetical protein